MTIKSELDKAQRDMERDAAQNRQPDPDQAPKIAVAPHMAGYVRSDSSTAARQKNAETDRNLSTVPTPRKP